MTETESGSILYWHLASGAVIRLPADEPPIYSTEDGEPCPART